MSAPRVSAPSPAPAAPTSSSVAGDAAAATTSSLLARQGAGFMSTIRTGGLGDLGPIYASTARLLGLSR